MKKLPQIILGLLFLSSLAFAGVREHEVREAENAILKKRLPNCINVRTYYDQVYCAGKIYAVLDDVLNDVYKDLRKKLSKKQKNRLKKVQIHWIRDRDDKCASIENSQITLNLTCAKNKTIESIIYLYQMNKNTKDFDILLKEYRDRK